MKYFPSRLRARLIPVAIIAFSSLAAGCGLFGGEPRLPDALVGDLSYVPANARIVASMEPTLAAEGFREFVRSVDLTLAVSIDSAEAYVRRHAGDLPIDPMRDVDRVVAFASGPQQWGFLARGDFDTDRVAGFIDRAIPESLATRDGNAWTVQMEGRSATIRLVGPDLLTATADAAGLAAGEGPGDELRAMITTVAQYPAWVAALEIPMPPAHSDSLRGSLPGAALEVFSVRRMAMGVRPAADLMEGAILLWPAEGVSADDLADLVRGAVSMVRSDDQIPDDLRRRLDSVDVDSRDGYVKIEGRMAPADVKAIFRSGDGLLSTLKRSATTT